MELHVDDKGIAPGCDVRYTIFDVLCIGEGLLAPERKQHAP